MSLYENEICPVCKEEFCKGDDIVVCPECGTPHHRECYNLAGKCVNTGLHKAGYDYQKEKKENVNILKNEPIIQHTENQDDIIPIIGNAENESDDNNITKKPLNPVDIFKITDTDTVYEKDSQTIDGESVADFAATIKVNVPKFINKFKEMEAKNKKASWNWCAFFFGPIYLLARKMYKQGLAFICLSFSLLFAANTLILKFAPDYSKAVLDLVQSAQNVKSLNPNDLLSLTSIADAKTASIICYSCLGVFIVFRIIQGALANHFYKKTISSIVKRINNEFEDMSIISNPLMGFDENMSKTQLKKMLLAQKGGISFITPAMALWLIIMILNLI